jgi:CheY-like chemotaxis protein
VLGDSNLLANILINLGINARDAMPDGGTLSITWRRVVLDASAAARYAPGLVPGSWAELSVADTGHGIPPDVLPHVFEPFFTTKPIGQGTGLGLAMVWGAIRTHGGGIAVSSVPGQGTVFRIALQLSDRAAVPTPAMGVPVLQPRLRDPGIAQAVAAGSPAGPTPPPASRGELLLVDDDDIVREVARHLLTSLGWRVVAAPDGATALGLVDRRQTPFAIAVIDMLMPGMDGDELFRELRGRHPTLPVVVATGFAGDADLCRLTRQGAVVIGKPYRREELAAALSRVLGG